MSALPRRWAPAWLAVVAFGFGVGALGACSLPRKDDPSTCDPGNLANKCPSGQVCVGYICVPDDASVDLPDAAPGASGGSSGAGGDTGGSAGAEGGGGGASSVGGGGVGGGSSVGGQGGMPGSGGAPPPSCMSMNDCAAMTGKPLCDPGSHLCVACSDPVCAAISTAKPVCGVAPLPNTCVECNTADQCMTKTSTPVCAGGVCVACNEDSDCKGATAPICNKMTHVCGRCGAKADCMTKLNTPGVVCLGTGACAECAVNDDCAGHPGGPACSSANVCVQCTENVNCSGTTPICDKTMNKCVKCSGDSVCHDKSTALPICATTGNCVQCRANTDCTDPATPGCFANACVACTLASHCGGDGSAAPICDLTMHKCARCPTSQACADKNAALPVCLLTPGPGTCVQCQANSDCSGATPGCSAANKCVQCTLDAHCSGAMPICDTTANRCVPCTTDAQCKAKTVLGPNPGVCMSHVDGHCALDGETVYVENRSSCTDTGIASSALPLCSMNGAPAVISAARSLIVVRGAVSSANGPIALPAGRLLSVVGQNAAAITGTVSPALWIGGDTFARDLSLKSAFTACVASSGSILRLNHVTVASSPGGGIQIDGAGFDIRNTFVTGNGPGVFPPLTTWGGILINNPPAAGPSRLERVTVQNNQSAGIICSTRVTTSIGVLASGNGALDVFNACLITPCQPASATCGATP